MRVEKTAADRRLEKIIVPYRTRVDELLSEPVVVSEFPLEKGLPESGLSNAIADAVFTFAKTWSGRQRPDALPEMCLLNSGGIRTALPAGTLTMGQMYEVMPFENEIVLLRLTPQNMRALVDYVAEKGGAPVAGIRLQLLGDKAGAVELGRGAYAFDRDVWVATSDFLASGGDGMNFFAAPAEYLETKIKVRDAITGYFKGFAAEGRPLQAVKDGRIYR